MPMIFELKPADISDLNDVDLREMVARLCEADLIRQGIHRSRVSWGGAQEAADGGLDIRVSNAVSLNCESFVPRENTGFQVKKNSMSKAACANEMCDKGYVKSVINDLATQKGAYVIVSGKDDCSDKMLSERILGMQSAVDSLSNEDLLLDFYGRDRLSTWLREFPSVSLWVRSKLGKPLSGWEPFGRWAATPLDQDDVFLLDDHPCVIDLNTHHKTPISIAAGIKLIRDKLRVRGSAVRITGLSGVGKTRFAQALFEVGVGEDALPDVNVIYADLGDDLAPAASDLITYLIAHDLSAYVVLDNCPSDIHRKLQKQVSSTSVKLSLLTIEYDISDDRPEETEVIHIEPSSEETVSKLIQKRFSALGLVNANKISEFSGGNSRVAITLASRVRADETLSSFSDEDLFKRLFNQKKGVKDDLLESAEVLSLVYSFNISKSEFNDELTVLANLSGLNRRILHRHHTELLERHLAQKRGEWRAILPHALANRLAKRALQNITPDEVNSELFKSDNLRLFKSCAHRIGFLHEFEPARMLAKTWVQAGGPLYDIAFCDSETLKAFEFIAPIFPDTALMAIEAASKTPGFCSRNNEHYSLFVRLLRQLAYDDQYFDRAAELMLRFAEKENVSEKYDSIVSQLESLFSLYLSGTHATAKRRQAFIHRMLVSSNQRHFEIAQELFRTALSTSHWSSIASFDFGARIRDYGWEPNIYEEKLQWYIGFIELLKPLLQSDNEFHKKWAKVILVNHFSNLWNFVGCVEILDEIVCEYAVDGQWPEMWLVIKKTIGFFGENYNFERLVILKKLECLAAPSGIYSEVEAYVFASTWDHIEVRGESYSEKSREIEEKVILLGELCASKPEYLEKLAPRLWENHVNAIWIFGKGIAKGAMDQRSIFEFLIQLIREQELKIVEPDLFCGFIKEVYIKSPALAQQLQEYSLQIPELKLHRITLLLATPIKSWEIKKLIELAESKEIDAFRFNQIRGGCLHEAIPDNDLSKLLLALNNLEEGVLSVLKILYMRFSIDVGSKYIPSEELLAVGRETIFKLLAMHRDGICKVSTYDIDIVAKKCLSETAPESEIREIVGLLCEGVHTNRLSSIDLESITVYLVQNFPEIILDQVFENNNQSDQLAYLLFKDRIYHQGSALNLVSIERLVQWCDGNQYRIQELAKAVSSYISLDKEPQRMEPPQELKLSDHVKSLLSLAEDKTSIVENIYSSSFWGVFSGSVADTYEVRSKAFADLLEHESSEVREVAKGKLLLLNNEIRERRGREAKEYSQHEQRFE